MEKNHQKHPSQISKEKIKKIWSEAFTKDAPVTKLYLKEFVLAAFILNLVTIITVIILGYLNRLPPQVPLFYGSAEGDAQLTANWLLIIPSTVSVVFLLINVGLSFFLKDEFLKKTLIIATVALAFLSTVTTIKIISLVGNLNL